MPWFTLIGFHHLYQPLAVFFIDFLNLWVFDASVQTEHYTILRTTPAWAGGKASYKINELSQGQSFISYWFWNLHCAEPSKPRSIQTQSLPGTTIKLTGRTYRRLVKNRFASVTPRTSLWSYLVLKPAVKVTASLENTSYFSTPTHSCCSPAFAAAEGGSGVLQHSPRAGRFLFPSHSKANGVLSGFLSQIWNQLVGDSSHFAKGAKWARKQTFLLKHMVAMEGSTEQ